MAGKTLHHPSGRNRSIATEEESGIDLTELLPRIRFRAMLVLSTKWWILVLTCLTGILFQGFRTLQQQPTYVSEAQLILEGQVSLPEANAYREQMSMFFDTQADVMTSREVREDALNRVKAMHPELRQSQVTIQAYQKPRKAIFMLTATGLDPEYTQACLNATMDAYIAKRKQRRSENSESALLKVQDEIAKLEKEIEEGENEIVEFQKNNNLIFIQEQGTTAGTHLSQLKTKLADLQTQYQLLDTAQPGRLLNEDGATATADDSVATSLEALGPDEKYRQAKERLRELQAELAEYSIYMRPKHPHIMRLNEEITRTDNIIQIYQNQNMEQIAEEKEAVAQRIENLKNVIATWEVTALDLSRKLAEYDRLQSRLDRNRSLYGRLLDSIQSIDLNMNVDNEMITIYERASVPRKNQGSLPRQLFLGGTAGMAVGIIILAFFAVTESRIISAEDIQAKFDEPVLGILPQEKLDRKGQLPLLTGADSRHLFAEGCRGLRSSLLYGQQEGIPHVLMITSSVPGEGKSTVSSNLAAAIALTETRVLLIDSDLRRGALNKVFGVEQQKGLAEYLEGKLPREQAVRPSVLPFLDMIPTGEYPDQPGELLLHPRMDALLGWAREQYGIVICDTAPILASDDTSNLSNKVDGIVMIVRSLYTQGKHIKLCHDRLGPMANKLLGYVCNFADVRGADYYYYHHYTKKYYNSPKKRKAPEPQELNT